MKLRTPGKMLIENVETGDVIERWPVDANAMIKCGEFKAYEGGVEEEPVPPSKPVPHDVPPAEHSKGVALNVTKTEDAGEAAPVTLPDPLAEKPEKKAAPKPRGRPRKAKK